MELSLESLNLNANEITLDRNGVSEPTYSAQSEDLEVVQLKATLIAEFPELGQEDQSQWDILGFTKADQRNYFEDTFSLTYEGVPGKEVLREYQVPPEVQPIDCFTVKFQKQSHKKVLKIYDGNFEGYVMPALPPGFELAKAFGIGRHFGGNEQFRDWYFYHQDADAVAQFFGESMPKLSTDTEGQWYLFGACFTDVGEFVKLKRYVYPRDLFLMDRDRV